MCGIGITLLIITYLLSPATSHYNIGNVPLCGDFLSDILYELCKGQYAIRAKKKLTFPSDLTLDIDGFENALGPPKVQTHTNFRFPFKPRRAAELLIPSRFRRSSGIVEECCLKTCSLPELLGYCE